MDHEAPTAEPAMPCCCAQCGAAFDPRTQQQLKMLMRLADLGMGLAEAVAAFPLRTGHVDWDVTQNFELLGRGVRRCLALEAKLTEEARRRHAREAHGAPAVREPGEPAAKKLPPVTAEDTESVIGPEPVVREPGENLLGDTREKLLDRFVEDHSPAVVVASVCRDFGVEEDISVFLEPVRRGMTNGCGRRRRRGRRMPPRRWRRGGGRRRGAPCRHPGPLPQAGQGEGKQAE